MDLKAWFSALEKTYKAGEGEPEVTLRVLAPGALYEAKCGRKRVCAVDVEGALSGLLVARGGTVP